MNKFFNKSCTMAAMIVVSAAAAFSSSDAMAADQSITLNEPLTITMQNNLETFTFVAPDSGTLFIETDTWTLFDHTGNNILFTNPEGTAQVPYAGNRERGVKGWTYVYNVTKGTTYYFTVKEELVMDPITFTFIMQKEALAPKVTWVYPDDGADTPYNLALAPELQLTFNLPKVTCDGVYMIYQTEQGEKKFQLDYTIIEYDSSWRINIMSAYNQIGDEIIKNSTFYVQIVNPMANGLHVTGDYVDGENVMIPYKYVPMAVSTKYSWPNPFITFWPEGDPAGIAWIEFSQPLMPIEQLDKDHFECGIYAGNDRESEDGMTPLAKPKLSVEGNTLYIDFTGVSRPCDKSVVTVIISGILSQDNLPIFYNGNNAIDVELTYQRLEPIELVYELTPGSGSDIYGVKEIELWISNDTFNHLEFTGFTFSNGEASEIVAYEACRIIPDDYDPSYTLIYIPVPAPVASWSDVTLSADSRSLDGKDYTLTATYYNSNPSSGVDGIGEEAANEWTVFNLQGINVLNTKNHDDLNNLPAGIYIVNGRKIVIGNR